MCDLAECSKLHKERGMNSVQMGLLVETRIDDKEESQVKMKVLRNFYAEA